MKRLAFLVLIAAVAAGGILYGLRRAQTTPHSTVTALLPRGTIALVHFPDFSRTRDEWHQSDLYKLYQEPAVRDFLNRPLSRVPQRGATSETLGEMERLDLKDAFLAVTSVENNNPHFAGGFRFRGSQSEAENALSAPDDLDREAMTRHRVEQDYLRRDLFKDAKEATTSKNTVEFAKFIGSGLMVIEGDFQPNAASEAKFHFVQLRLKQGDKWLMRSLQLFVIGKD